VHPGAAPQPDRFHAPGGTRRHFGLLPAAFFLLTVLVLLAFHKPYGVLSQFTPEPGSAWKTLAKFGLPKGVYALGRLDADSEGLLLLSDEPGLSTRLLDPAKVHPREYWVQVERVPHDATLKQLARGVRLGDYQTLPCRVHRLETAPALPSRYPPVRYRKSVPDCWLSLELTEGKNRQVRRMTAAIGHPTLRLIRVRIGQLTLGELARGEWRELTLAERELVLG
jgi:23S rRNA pseudouridine2457 synthase